MKAIFPTVDGPVTIEYPDNMSQQSWSYFAEFITVFMKVMMPPVYIVDSDKLSAEDIHNIITAKPGEVTKLERSKMPWTK